MEIIIIVLITKFKREIALKQLSLFFFFFACTFLEFCFLPLTFFSLLCTLLLLLYGLLHVDCTDVIINSLNINLLTILSSRLLDKLKYFLNKGTLKHFILASQHSISFFLAFFRVYHAVRVTTEKKNK